MGLEGVCVCVTVSEEGFIFPEYSGLTAWQNKIQSRRKWSNCSSFLGRAKTVATAMPSHRILHDRTDITALSGLKRNEKGPFLMALNIYKIMMVKWKEAGKRQKGRICVISTTEGRTHRLSYCVLEGLRSLQAVRTRKVSVSECQ